MCDTGNKWLDEPDSVGYWWVTDGSALIPVYCHYNQQGQWWWSVERGSGHLYSVSSTLGAKWQKMAMPDLTGRSPIMSYVPYKNLLSHVRRIELEDGSRIVEQEGEWHLFDRNGEGIFRCKSLPDLLYAVDSTWEERE